MDEEFSSLVEEIEGHLQRYLQRSQEAYPEGSQADGVATAVVQRVQAGATQTDFQSLVKLCVFLVENLEDISKTYEEFYSEQMNSLKEDSAALRSRLANVEEENSQLREQLHRDAEELKVREMTIRSLKGPASSKGSLSSSFSRPAVDLHAAVTEAAKENERLKRSLHEEKMKNCEFDEKFSVDGDEDEGEEEEKEEELHEEGTADALNSSCGSAVDASKMGIFNRELIEENTELQSRIHELLRENAQYRELSAQLKADNANLKTATKELRCTVERLHNKLHSDDLLCSQASQIFEQLLQDNRRLGQLSQSPNQKAAADALAADETFDIDGEEEEISDSEGDGRSQACRHCAKLKEAVQRLEERHAEEAVRISEIVTQNVCMKSELEEWKADMAEKVRQNVDLNSQIENYQRLLNRLSPKKTSKARSVFGSTLIRK